MIARSVLLHGGRFCYMGERQLLQYTRQLRIFVGSQLHRCCRTETEKQGQEGMWVHCTHVQGLAAEICSAGKNISALSDATMSSFTQHSIR